MKIKLKEFKEKSFLIPLSTHGQWEDYKQFSAMEWKKSVINVLRLVMTAENPTAHKEEITKMAQQQVDIFVNNIKNNLSPHTPCLALAFPPAKCWFIAFIVDAFIPLENTSENNIFAKKHYAQAEQSIAIVKAKGDPVVFALELVNELEFD